MKHRSAILTVLLALALVLPAASATWRVHGSFEPDTAADRTGGFMYDTPDTDPDTPAKIYFNGFLGVGYFSSYNPNVGATESRVILDGFQFPFAFLGAWKDCNDDGYIGMAEDAFGEYPSALLLSTSICAVNGDHNRNGWVTEFLWIAPGSVVEEEHHPHGVLNDEAAYVWGDAGLPDTEATPPGSCFINPQRGFFSSTGAMLLYGDCMTGRAIATGVNCLTVGAQFDVGGENVPCPALDPDNELGLAFSDPNYPSCSSSLLNQRIGLFSDDPRCEDDQANTLEDGNAEYRRKKGYEEQPAFTVWDCSSGSPEVDPRHTGEGSYYDGVNHTYRVVEGGCDADRYKDNTLSGVYASPEYDVAAGEDAIRQTDFPFRFQHPATDRGHCGFYGSPSSRLDPQDVNWCDAGVPSPTGEDTPQLAGVGLLRGGFAGIPGPVWMAPTGQSNLAPTVEVSIEGRSYEISDPRYYVWYASVGDAVLSAGHMVPGATGIYGSEFCGNAIGPGQPLAQPSLFDCDPTHWWNEEFGASAEGKQGDRVYTVKVGQPYNLKDVDCYDGSLASGFAPGVGYGLTWLKNPCQR